MHLLATTSYIPGGWSPWPSAGSPATVLRAPSKATTADRDRTCLPEIQYDRQIQLWHRTPNPIRPNGPMFQDSIEGNPGGPRFHGRQVILERRKLPSEVFPETRTCRSSDALPFQFPWHENRRPNFESAYHECRNLPPVLSVRKLSNRPLRPSRVQTKG